MPREDFDRILTDIDATIATLTERRTMIADTRDVMFPLDDTPRSPRSPSDAAEASPTRKAASAAHERKPTRPVSRREPPALRKPKREDAPAPTAGPTAGKRGERSRRVVELLAARGQLRVAEIADALGQDRKLTGIALCGYANKKLIKAHGQGVYGPLVDRKASTPTPLRAHDTRAVATEAKDRESPAAFMGVHTPSWNGTAFTCGRCGQTAKKLDAQKLPIFGEPCRKAA